MNDCIPFELSRICRLIMEYGGTPLLVGGCVRDSLMGVGVKDYDVEVYEMVMSELISCLKVFGKVSVVGQSFGVIKLHTECAEYDFSLPRRENRVGVGHKDFSIEVDATLSPIEAASRRDFTINSMMMDPLSGEIIDHFGGKHHLSYCILHPTSPAYREDALRVLRGMQFAGRFQMWASLDCRQMSQKMKEDYSALPRERIWGEWEKWANKSVKPSMGIWFLSACDWINLYPQIAALHGCEQDPIWHPEGDAFIHTMHVIDHMAIICERDGIKGEDRIVLMMAALCHDFGKPSCSEFIDGRIRSRGHEEAGVIPAREFLESIGCFPRIIERVLPLVRDHLQHVHLDANGMSRRGVNRLARRLEPSTIPELAKLIEADMGGRPPLPKGLPQSAISMLELAKQCKVENKGPERILTGKILIEEFDVAPGPHMGEILKAAYEAQLDGIFDSEDGAIGWYKEFQGVSSFPV